MVHKGRTKPLSALYSEAVIDENAVATRLQLPQHAVYDAESHTLSIELPNVQWDMRAIADAMGNPQYAEFYINAAYKMARVVAIGEALSQEL